MELPRGRRARVVVFVLVVVAAAVIGAGGSIVRDSPDVPDYPEYQPSSIVPVQAGTSGHPEISTAEERGLVVIDASHGNRFDREAIQPLISAIAETGYQVEVLHSKTNLDAALSRADAVVVFNPAQSYTQREVDRIESFVAGGGRLVLFGEPTQLSIVSTGLGTFLLQIDNRLDSIAQRFGIQYGERHLYNMQTNEGNYLNIFATGTNAGTAARVEQAAFYTAVPVATRSGQRILVASDGTRSDRGDTAGDFAVAVRSGNVLAVGDTTFLMDGKHTVADNEHFVANIVDFMVSGSRQRTLLDYPAIVPSNPTVVYTNQELLNAAKMVSTDLKESRSGQPRIELSIGPASQNTTDILVTTFDYLETHALPTGVTVRRNRVAVPGYESRTTGVAVIHTQPRRYGVVIAADTPTKAEAAVDALVDGSFEQHTITNTTAIIAND